MFPCFPVSHVFLTKTIAVKFGLNLLNSFRKRVCEKILFNDLLKHTLLAYKKYRQKCKNLRKNGMYVK